MKPVQLVVDLLSSIPNVIVLYRFFNAELLAKSSQSVKTFLPKKFKSSESFTSYQVLIRLALQSVFVASMK